ncbi:MAG: DUF1559 domain-containing protein, partial [Planctomycetes bacterium]|nr:DUF1559 domain-containing protein [Planctomycetota bacterium]
GTLNDTGPIESVPQGYHHDWLEQLLPYMEERNTYNHIDFSVGVYDEKNAPVRDVQIPTLRCPSSSVSQEKWAYSNYAGCHHDVEAPIDVDNNGVFFLNSAVHYEDILDGTTQTIFIGEKLIDVRSDLGWMSGTRWTLRNTGTPINQTLSAQRNRMARPDEIELDDSPTAVGGFGSFHPGGANFVMGDGSINFLSQSLDLAVLQQCANRADGKLLPRRP